MNTVKEILPRVVSRGEARELADMLRSHPAHTRRRHSASLVGADGTTKVLPVALYDLLVAVVGILESGSGVTVVPLGAELTTAETAELLNVSRPHVVKMLETGEMAFHKVGTHRRVYLDDVLKFREARDAQFHEAMTKIHEVSEQLDLPD